MAKVIKYVGRSTNFEGKTLWEIIGNLKNFGVGRLVIRSTHEKYEGKNYYKIMEVQTLPNCERRKVRVWAEKTFRGQTSAGLVEITSATYKDDYKLVHKHEEAQLYEDTKPVTTETILPRSIEMPPLLREYYILDSNRKGLEVGKLELPLKFQRGKNNRSRLAEEGETPTVQVSMGLGTPKSPNLYKGVNLN